MSNSLGIVLGVLLVLMPACGGSATGTGAPTSTAEALFPDVVAVEVEQMSNGMFKFDVTMSSPYDTPARYADAWRITSSDGVVFGIRVLTHDHASEQPFTRSLSNVEIPSDVDSVVVEGRDLLSGWGGNTVTVTLP